VSTLSLPWGLPLPSTTKAPAVSHPLLSPWRVSLFIIMNVIILPIPSDCGPPCGHGEGSRSLSSGPPQRSSLGAVSGGRETREYLGTVRVVPFQIRERPIPGVTETSGAEALRNHLADEATARAIRTLRDHKKANVTEGPSEGETSPDAPLTLSGTVSLPLFVPPRLRGFDAGLRRAPFATAAVTLTRPDGTTVGSEEATLRWKDVRWLRGARRKRNRPIEDILQDFTRKSVDHSVRRLERRISPPEGRSL
jgi:hypothetical protein